MRWFSRLYGSNPLHLLVSIACFALAGYAAYQLRAGDVRGILIWLAGAVIGHDLILFPVYAIADRSMVAVFRRRPPALPAVPWINYLRVPAVFSAILLLMWFPLIFRLPKQFTVDHTALPITPYLGRWLAITGALFLLSAITLALRLGTRHRAPLTPSREGAMPPRRDIYPVQGTPPNGSPRSVGSDWQVLANVPAAYDHRDERYSGGRAAQRYDGYPGTSQSGSQRAVGRHRSDWDLPS